MDSLEQKRKTDDVAEPVGKQSKPSKMPARTAPWHCSVSVSFSQHDVQVFGYSDESSMATTQQVKPDLRTKYAVAQALQHAFLQVSPGIHGINLSSTQVTMVVFPDGRTAVIAADEDEGMECFDGELELEVNAAEEEYGASPLGICVLIGCRAVKSGYAADTR